MSPETSLLELQQALAAFQEEQLEPEHFAALFLRFQGWVVPGQLTHDGVLFPDTVEVAPGEEWLLVFSAPDILTALDESQGLNLGERTVLATGLEVAAECFPMVCAIGLDLGAEHQAVVQGGLLQQMHELAREVLKPEPPGD